MNIHTHTYRYMLIYMYIWTCAYCIRIHFYTRFYLYVCYIYLCAYIISIFILVRIYIHAYICICILAGTGNVYMDAMHILSCIYHMHCNRFWPYEMWKNHVTATPSHQFWKFDLSNFIMQILVQYMVTAGPIPHRPLDIPIHVAHVRTNFSVACYVVEHIKVEFVQVAPCARSGTTPASKKNTLKYACVRVYVHWPALSPNSQPRLYRPRDSSNWKDEINSLGPGSFSWLYSWGPTICSPKSPRWPADGFMIVFLMVDPCLIPLEPAPNQCSMIFFLGRIPLR